MLNFPTGEKKKKNTVKNSALGSLLTTVRNFKIMLLIKIYINIDIFWICTHTANSAANNTELVDTGFS